MTEDPRQQASLTNLPNRQTADQNAPAAIQVDHVSKAFRLVTERRDSLKERFIRGRSKGVHHFQALSDVTFEVPRGQTVALIGHNGSGKSTMLKLLAGVHRPDAGSIVTRGRISALLELGAGFHGELTGRENIYLNAAILGLSRKETEAAIGRIVDFADIGEFIDSPVKVYSSGMYLRLGFAIAVTVEPQILIIDEIIAVGDEQFQRKCFDYLHELRRKGTTIVLVSHALGIVEEICETAVWLDHGVVRRQGPAREIVKAYLDEVNQRELEQAPPAPEAADPQAADPEPVEEQLGQRVGSGEAKIVDVTLLGPSGRRSPVLISGQPATFRLHYQAQSPLTDAVFGLGFFTDAGVFVAGPNSGQSQPVAALAEHGSVDFHVPRLHLAPGTYTVSTSLMVRTHNYDFVDRGYMVRVRGSSGSEPGLTRMFGDWSSGPATDAAPAGELESLEDFSEPDGEDPHARQ